MTPTIQNIHLDGNELIIRTGSAPEPFNPNPISVSGTVESLKSYVQNRNLDAYSVRVEYSFENGFVKLVDNEGFPNQYTVNGQLQISKDFKSILGTHSDPTQLSDLLRKNRRIFTDQTEGAKLVAALKNFKGNVEKQLEKVEDKRAGQYKSAVEKVVSSNLPETITLKMEIVKGQPPVEFLTDIYVDVRDNGVSITLESIEAEEFAEKIKQEVISDCIETVMKPAGFFCIEV